MQGLRRSNPQLFKTIHVFYRKVHKNTKNIRSDLCPILYVSREPLKLKPEALSHEPSRRSNSSAYSCVRSESESQRLAMIQSVGLGVKPLLRLTLYAVLFCNAHEN